MLKIFLILILGFSINLSAQSGPINLAEDFQTKSDTLDNVDSPAVWHSPEGETWVITTAKETDLLLVYNGETGKLIKKIGGSGSKPGQLERPNGVVVIDSLCAVVERDNRRIQIFSLPEFNFIGFVADTLLEKPYGLTVFKDDAGYYRLYVTDNYETVEETVPPDSLLNKRVHAYKFKIGENGKIFEQQVRTFGETKGLGVLSIVESIYADPLYNNLLVAEEDETQSSVKVYDLDGNFKGIIFGIGIFKHQVEGIALYECGKEGYWVVTDQTHGDNVFHVFDRRGFNLIGSFKLNNTENTDGIALTQSPVGNFTDGAFYAVHDDKAVSGISWKKIAEALSLKLCEK